MWTTIQRLRYTHSIAYTMKIENYMSEYYICKG